MNIDETIKVNLRLFGLETYRPTKITSILSLIGHDYLKKIAFVKISELFMHLIV